MNRGLLFMGLPPPPLRGSEQKDYRNPLGSRPSNGINVGAAVGGSQCPCSITGRQLIAKSFAQDRHFTKICLGPMPVGASFSR